MYRTFHYLDTLYYVSCIVFADFILVYWVCQSDCSTFDIGQTHLVLLFHVKSPQISRRFAWHQAWHEHLTLIKVPSLMTSSGCLTSSKCRWVSPICMYCNTKVYLHNWQKSGKKCNLGKPYCLSQRIKMLILALFP